MALSETARLIASLELKDKLTPGVDRAVGKLAKLEGTFGRIGQAAQRGVGTAARNIAAIGAVAAVAVGSQVKSGLESLAALEDATTAVDAAIKATGKSGQVTAKQVADWANEIESSVDAAFDDKDITRAASTLLRFGKVTTQNLRPALAVMTDLAVKTGSVDSAATLLAKALADPTKAAGALRRAGVTLTKQQQEQIKALVEAGRAGEAQALVLRELEKATKGAAKASAGPYRDSLNILADTVEDAQRALGEGFLPVITKVRDILQRKLADPKTIQALRDFGKGAAQGLDKLIDMAGKIPWSSIGDAMKLAGQGAKAIFDAFTGLPPWVQTAVLTGWGLNKLTGGALGTIVGELGKGLVKGVLGLNAGVVNAKAAVVNVAGGAGAGGAVAAGGGVAGKLGGILKIAGAVTIAGVALELLRETADNTAKQIGDAQEALRNDVSKTTTQGFKETVDNLNSVAKSIRGMSGLDQILLDTFGNSEVFADFRDGAQRLVSAAGLSEGQLRQAREAIVAARDALLDLNRTDQAAELDRSIAAIDKRIASGVQSGVEPLLASNHALIDAHDKTDGVFTKAIAAFLKKRPPEAVENFRKAQERVGKSDTFTVIAKASGTDKSLLPVVQNLVRSLTQGNSPWARDLSVMKGHLANLKGLEQKFQATGDTKSAAIVRGAITTLQGAITTRQEIETQQIRLAKQAAEGTGDAVDRTRGAILTSVGKVAEKQSIANTVLGLVRTATLGIVPGLGPKVNAVGAKVGLIPAAIARNKPVVSTTVTLNSRVVVSGRQITSVQTSTSKFGHQII